jgi:hypothetical protein
MQNRGALCQRDGAPVRRREECRPLAPGIPTLHARTPINTDLSRKFCAIVAAEETPANGAANGLMHSLRAILNNPLAITPNTDPSRRVASGWEPHHKNTDLSRKILIVQKTSAAEETPARPERGCSSKRIPTAHARIGGEGLENTDLPHKECRPFAQRIPTFRAKNTDLLRKGLPTAGARDYRLPAQERRRIQTARTSNTDLSHKAAPGNTCKSIHFADMLPFPCSSCVCLMFCCSKKSGG